MNHDTLAIIIGYLPYESLYDTIKVSRLFAQASKKQLIIRHKANPILPILHNGRIHAEFIHKLKMIYTKYLMDYEYKTAIDLFVRYNKPDYMGYEDKDFINLLDAEKDTSFQPQKYIFANREVDTDKDVSLPADIHLNFKLLYAHIINNINMINSCEKYTHSLINYYKPLNLFEKGLVIYMYLTAQLTIVYKCNKNPIGSQHPWIIWNISLLGDKIF